MSNDLNCPNISFLWRHNEIASSVVEASRSTGARALFDIEPLDLDAAATALLKADVSGETSDLKLSPEALFDPALEELLRDTDVDTIWVELHPLLLTKAPEAYIERILALAPETNCIPVISDLETIRRIPADWPQLAAVALKGAEASGFVSSENIFTLYATVRSLFQELSNPPKIYIWGGVALPEAAAAFLCAGAAGIVFESVHWLTDLATRADSLEEKIARLRLEHTDLVGLNLNVPCRLYNKGNSRAVKELKQFAGSLCGAEIRDEQRRFFVNRIVDQYVHPLESSLSKDELIPLGVEACFAGSFVQRYGGNAQQAIDRFISEIDSLCRSATDKLSAFVNSPVAAEMGSEYPFVQGAMSWISDVPRFAADVAEAGGIPTLALGMMSRAIIDEKFGALGETMSVKPYAVNVIALQENPYRDEQLEWIKSQKPKFAVIAAGEPSHGRELLDNGIEVIYIAPTEELLKMAFEAGIKYAICEGNEAGGHVGQHSTLTMAQMVLDLKHRDPDLFTNRRVVLAGGVCDRETAFMAAMLGADAIQMGTCYLATKEIVESGALTELYQKKIVEAEPGSTVVTGEATGLRVRSLHTNRMEAICSLERDFAAGSEEESSFRHKIEALSAGSLFIAARGLDKPDGTPLDEEACVEKGQFMSGSCAGLVSRVVSVKELHQELASGKLAEGLPFVGPLRETSARKDEDLAATSTRSRTVSPISRTDRPERIAITGMSIVNALGNSPEEIWQACLEKRSGITEVPPSRWDHSLFYDPRPRIEEKTYCSVGAFQNLEVSRKDLDIPPQDFRTMTDSTRITMWLAKQAVESSGILDSDIPKDRIAVLISQNAGEAAATLQDTIIRGAVNKLVGSLKTAVQLTPDMEQAVEQALKAGRMPIDDTTLLGRLNCAAAGFICNKYEFQGPSYAVSAACATALVALYSAYQMIRNGVIDAAVVGGAEEVLTPMHFLEFSAIGVLAGLSGVERRPAESSRPFDLQRDGMVLGEGGGMIVIERESVAKRRGAQIHGYITSMGAGNNHLGMVEPSHITQETAIEASFRDSSYGPEGVDLVECHATSTVQGDIEEVLALKKFMGKDRGVILTSFKSQIGHTLGASGINSLIRGVMGMKAGICPPTINYDYPDPGLGLDAAGMTVCQEPQEWAPRNGAPRRMQVNAFGFGGSNYVLQVEENREAKDVRTVSPPDLGKAPSKPGDAPRTQSIEGISFFRTQIGGKAYRMGVVADTEKDALATVERSEPIGNGGSIQPKRMRMLVRQGIYLGLESQPTPPLAFVFPGQGSHYAGMSHELYETFPVIRDWMDRIAKVADFDLLHLLFHDKEEDLQKTRWQQPALFTMEYAMVQFLVSMGVKPTALAGHSLGELTALCLAGVFSYEDGFRLVNKRAVCMDKACDLNVDPGIMMAVDAPLDYLEERMRSMERIYVTNLNSPRQIVLGGDTKLLTEFGEELKKEGYRRTRLRVSMAFHSPIMECIHDELEEFLESVEFHSPKIPVISNTTMRPFPDDTAEIKRIVMAHLESPVHWMQNVQTLWDDYGVRLFVEVGPRDILSNMIGDCIEEAECVQTCLPSAESLIYRNASAQLYAKGNLPVSGTRKTVVFPGQGPSAAKSSQVAGSSPLAAAPVASADPLERIIQREINSFVLESFGRFLRPSLLSAIQRDYDSSFTPEKLDSMLSRMFSGYSAGGPAQFAPLPPVEGPSVAPVASVAPSDAVTAAQTQADSEPQEEDITEAVIMLIMDATGYEREEIEPEMDLREDLSIRSSRLPVIMDAMESHFGIKIELEEFMDVRTIKDISEAISKLTARQKQDSPAKAAGQPTPSEEIPPKHDEVAEESEEELSLKRLVFQKVALDETAFQPLELDTMDSVTIFSALGGTGLRKEVAKVFRRDYGVTPVLWSFMKDEAMDVDELGDGFDIRATDCAAMAEQQLGEMESLAGMVFIIDHVFDGKSPSMEEVSRVLQGFFCLIKKFLDSPAKRFVMLVHRGGEPDGIGRVLAEGMQGMFLSMSHEFSSVQFRSVTVDQETDLRIALRGALDRSRKEIELIYEKGEAFTIAGSPEALRFGVTNGLRLDPGDLILVSGGGYGVTSRLAATLARFGCRLALLGRTELDPNIDYHRILSEEDDPEAAIVKVLEESHAGQPEDEFERSKRAALKSLEVARNLERLRAKGAQAYYYSCDVSNLENAESVVGAIVKEHGPIAGIIHGAGFLRDSFVKQMSEKDFSSVVNVKFLGAWNLFRAVDPSKLKFCVALSSAAAIQGNPGQVNYAAGNRIMSALISHLAARHESVLFKAFMLPPIEGAGMAENEDIRAFMKRMNAAYVHSDELSALFGRELCLGPIDEHWVMFLRSLPDVASVRLDQSEPKPASGSISAAAVEYPTERFPMIDSITHMDLKKGELSAVRAFSREKDLWLTDHKPFKFLKYPLVSAIMALETFMECSSILVPHLKVTGIRDARFLDIISCPPGIDRQSEIVCLRSVPDSPELSCELVLSTKEISPSGRLLDSTSPNYKARVVMAGERPISPEDQADFPVRDEELDSRPMFQDEVLQWYEDRTDMMGRYRLVKELSGSGPDAIRGSFIYRRTEDFASPLGSHYVYSPYLLEAIMQVVNFYVIMRDQHERRSMIPYQIGAMDFYRECEHEEVITVEARARERTEEGIRWDARGVDRNGTPVMIARDMVMRWFSS